MRVCLVIDRHLSNVPRAVRAADALVEAGHDVRVVGPSFSTVLLESDQRLVRERKWRLDVVDWRSDAPRGWYRSIGIRGRRRVAAEVAERFPGNWTMRYAYKPGTPEIARQAARERADWYIGHAHGALPAAAIAAARYGARLGFDCEDLLAESECGDPPDIVRRIERVYLPQCDAVFVTSLAMEHRLTSLYGSLPTTVLYNVPSESMATGMVPPNRRTQPGPLRLYWIGQTVGPKRAIEDAVRAAVLLHGDAEIHLRGEVARGYREQLLESARPAGVANLIHFHGRVAPDAVVRTMDEFDVGLALQLSSDLNANLTTSNKLFGYMLAGLAIAGTDTAGHREVMSAAPGAGFLYSGGNVEALAGRLKGWADRRDMLLAAQMAAWNGARSRFTWDIEKQSYVMALEAPSSNQPVDAPESDSAVV